MATLRTIATPQASARRAAGSILARALSFPVFLAVLLVAGVFINARVKLADPDTWWHVAVGERILTTGTWPTSDIYSFTVPGSHWVAYEWLGEVVMALAARFGGIPALLGLLIGLSCLLLLLLYYYTYLRSGNVKAAFVACTLLLPLAVAFFTLRPQLLGYAYLLITLICLEHFRQGRGKVLWILPGVFLLWVNTHGSFVLGLVVMGVYWVSGLVGFRWGELVGEAWTREQRRQLLLVILLCLLVLPLTPYGTRLAAYPVEMALSQPVNVANIQEWQPLEFSDLWGKIFLGFLMVFFLAQVFFRPSYHVGEIALLLVAVYAACIHLRFVLLFVIVFAPLLALLLARWVPGYEPAKDRPALNVVLILLISAGLVGLFPSDKDLGQMVDKVYPRQAVEYLREHPVAGPMFNEYGWGGYLIWKLGPEHKVFIDGRADIYEYAGVLSDYLRIARLDADTLFLLRKYDVQACLLERKAPLATLLAALPDWERVYTDKLSALYVRKRRDRPVELSASPLPAGMPRPGN